MCLSFIYSYSIILMSHDMKDEVVLSILTSIFFMKGDTLYECYLLQFNIFLPTFLPSLKYSNYLS